MADENEKSGIWIKVLLVAIGFFLILGVSFFISGGQGIVAVIKTFFYFFIGLFVIGVISFIVWFLFFKEFERNVVNEEKEAIIETAIISKPENVTELWLSGDEMHPPVLLGTITGISYRKNYKLLTEEIKQLSQEEMKEYLKEHNIIQEGMKFYQEETDFVFKKGLLGKNKVLRVPPKLHTKIHGAIKVLDIGIVKHSKYYYPQCLHLDFASIDQTIYEESLRRTKLSMLEFLHPLMKWASGIKRRFEKEIETKMGKEILEGKTK